MPHKISLTEKAMWEILDSKRIKYFIDRHPRGFNPDIIIPLENGNKLLCYVDECFWHQCPIHYPNPNKWRDGNGDPPNKKDPKIMAKIKEDKTLVGIRIWEHDIGERPEWILEKILEYPVTYGELDEFTVKQKKLAGLPPSEPAPIEATEPMNLPKTPKYQIVLDGWFASEENAIKYAQSILPESEKFKIMRLNGWYVE